MKYRVELRYQVSGMRYIDVEADSPKAAEDSIYNGDGDACNFGADSFPPLQASDKVRFTGCFAGTPEMFRLLKASRDISQRMADTPMDNDADIAERLTLQKERDAFDTELQRLRKAAS